MALALTRNQLKFMAVILIFLTSLLNGRKTSNKSDSCLLVLGMFFTVFADLYLTLLGINPPGLALFCLVQIIYMARYDSEGFEVTIRRLAIPLIVLLFLLGILFYSGGERDGTLPLAIFYALCLYISFRKSYRQSKNGSSSSKGPLIVWAMVFFILGDINVALSYLDIYADITSRLIWVFYLPSQILLAHSHYELIK